MKPETMFVIARVYGHDDGRGAETLLWGGEIYGWQGEATALHFTTERYARNFMAHDMGAERRGGEVAASSGWQGPAFVCVSPLFAEGGAK